MPDRREGKSWPAFADFAFPASVVSRSENKRKVKSTIVWAAPIISTSCRRCMQNLGSVLNADDASSAGKSSASFLAL